MYQDFRNVHESQIQILSTINTNIKGVHGEGKLQTQQTKEGSLFYGNMRFIYRRCCGVFSRKNQ